MIVVESLWKKSKFLLFNPNYSGKKNWSCVKFLLRTPPLHCQNGLFCFCKQINMTMVTVKGCRSKINFWKFEFIPTKMIPIWIYYSSSAGWKFSRSQFWWLLHNVFTKYTLNSTLSENSASCLSRQGIKTADIVIYKEPLKEEEQEYYQKWLILSSPTNVHCSS